MTHSRFVLGIILSALLSVSALAETDCADALKSKKCEDIPDANSQIFKDCCPARTLGQRNDVVCEKKVTNTNPAGPITLPVDDGKEVNGDGSVQAK